VCTLRIEQKSHDYIFDEIFKRYTDITVYIPTLYHIIISYYYYCTIVYIPVLCYYIIVIILVLVQVCDTCYFYYSQEVCIVLLLLLLLLLLLFDVFVVIVLDEPTHHTLDIVLIMLVHWCSLSMGSIPCVQLLSYNQLKSRYFPAKYYG
jgi:hypothetical protein